MAARRRVVYEVAGWIVIAIAIEVFWRGYAFMKVVFNE
jgi:hypothetical protein